MENFESISGQILTWANKSEEENDGRTLRQVIKLIFEKATDEAHWSEMYARLCRKMMDTLGDKVSDEKVVDSKGAPVTGGSLFRKYLLNRCQEDFEKGWAARESSHAAAQSKAADDKAKIEANAAAEEAAKESGQDKPKEEAALMSDEYYVAQKAKRQGLGLVRLIGELFKLEMLTERIMHECVKRLLANVVTPEEEDIESLCRLLTTVGKTLDSPKAKPHMDVYFSRMNQLRNNPVVASRMQFMLLVRSLSPFLFLLVSFSSSLTFFSLFCGIFFAFYRRSSSFELDTGRRGTRRREFRLLLRFERRFVLPFLFLFRRVFSTSVSIFDLTSLLSLSLSLFLVVPRSLKTLNDPLRTR